jgi:hypothetical protein
LNPFFCDAASLTAVLDDGKGGEVRQVYRMRKR